MAFDILKQQINRYYNRQDQGCHFIDHEEYGKYSVFDADGNFLCVTDFDGATNVCEALESMMT